jgi:signal peptidase
MKLLNKGACDNKMINRFSPTRISKAKCLLLVGCLLFLYILDNSSILPVIDFEYIDYIKLLLWIGLALLIVRIPRIRFSGKLKHKNSIAGWAVIFGLINIMVMILAGFFFGFGKSPYSQTLSGIIINIFTIGTKITGKESARNYLVNSLTKEERYTVFIPIAVFMTLLNYPVISFFNLKGFEATVKYIAQYVVPDFCQNLMATYMSFLAGWIPPLLYMSIIQAFNWLSPILPDLNWIAATFIGILCPVFSLIAMQGIYFKETRVFKKREEKKQRSFGWVVTCLISIFMVWFAVGVFPVYPSVIATGSMEPMIKPGDMILVRKILKEEEVSELKEGDIIQFKRGDILISHRIIKIVEDDKGKSFVTKGDNNSSVDSELVKPEYLKGKISYVVPKIGWLTLLVKQKQDNPIIHEVEF